MKILYFSKYNNPVGLTWKREQGRGKVGGWWLPTTRLTLSPEVFPEIWQSFYHYYFNVIVCYDSCYVCIPTHQTNVFKWYDDSMRAKTDLANPTKNVLRFQTQTHLTWGSWLLWVEGVNVVGGISFSILLNFSRPEMIGWKFHHKMFSIGTRLSLGPITHSKMLLMYWKTWFGGQKCYSKTNDAILWPNCRC